MQRVASQTYSVNCHMNDFIHSLANANEHRAKSSSRVRNNLRSLYEWVYSPLQLSFNHQMQEQLCDEYAFDFNESREPVDLAKYDIHSALVYELSESLTNQLDSRIRSPLWNDAAVGMRVFRRQLLVQFDAAIEVHIEEAVNES